MKTLNHLALCAVLIVAGCGETDTDGRVAVSGNITYHGNPLAEGRINFTPANGNSGLAAGGKIAEGRFRINAEQGPTAGEYKVIVTVGGVPSKDSTIGSDPNKGLPLQSQAAQTFEFIRSVESNQKNLMDFDLLPQSSDRSAGHQ